jgi:hypothetical protein
MGSETSKPERIIVNNIPTVTKNENHNMSTLNLSIEEILKEVSIVILIKDGKR